jgi:hypothetical protein
MALPGSFTQDAHTAKLAAYFEAIYTYLVDQGVPEERLPSPWHVLSHVVDCLDEERVGDWLEAYVGIEGVSPETEPEPLHAVEPPAPKAPAKRPRPGYLRALTDTLTQEASKSDPSSTEEP